jgi:beta-lactamase class A
MKVIKNLLITLFIILCLGIIAYFYIFYTTNNTSQIISPLATTTSMSPTEMPIISEVTTLQTNFLKQVVDKALDGTTGTYAVAIKNLKTKESYYSDEHRIFDTGSLYKLWIMALVYEQIQNGQLKRDQVLSQDVVTLNKKFSIDPEFAELTEGSVTFTVGEALNQMITISHNYAALLLTEKIRLTTVADFLKSNNLYESAVGISGGVPTSTAYDIGLFLEKLYSGEFANQQYTDEMISLLKKQQLNDGLPKLLSVKSEVAHKTGEIDGFKHDAGIVFTDFGDYIIVVMSESDYPLGAQERIASISKGVFDYFSSK